jgi:hypothetical protein
VWGLACVKIAAVFLASNAVIKHLVAYLLPGAGSAGRPKDFKHVDGGVYNGEWSGVEKQGLGVYRYALVPFQAIPSFPIFFPSRLIFFVASAGVMVAD